MNVELSYHHDVAQQFTEQFGDRFEINVSLARYTSARVGGQAEMFVTVRSAGELLAAAELAYKTGTRYFVLGGGSNILVSDHGVRGLVIHNKARHVQFRHAGAGIICTAESGTNLSSLARQCIGKGLGGLEWAIGVPGTVGGAVVGNAGAHGGDMHEILVAATIWEPGRGVRTYSVEEMEFGYRDSILKREQAKYKSRRLVLSAEIRLSLEPSDVLLARAEGFTARRKETQPGGASTGSMFKNPENYYAGYLIDAAGLKGARTGQARISEKHANFFINEGGASAEEIRSLIAEAWHTVRERFGVEMDLEVELVGDWEFEDKS